MDLWMNTKRRLRRLPEACGVRIFSKRPVFTEKSNSQNQIEPKACLLPCDVRTKDHILGGECKTYGTDQSGKITYQFNSVGYRSEELDPSASFRICVIGESHAFGVGVQFEHTFGQRFKSHYCAALGLPLSSVNLLNLSVGGASADYCVRTLIRQIDVIRPDLIIAQFPSHDRIEYINKESILSYSVTGIDLSKLNSAPIALQGFCDFYSEPFGQMNTVRNALLMQSFCQVRNIDFIISAGTLVSTKYHGTIADQLYRHLDQMNILSHGIMHNKLDLASDGGHAGPKTHDALAIALLDKFVALQSWNGKISGMAEYVTQLKAQNPDWPETEKKINFPRQPA